jgi:hypothetical protein
MVSDGKKELKDKKGFYREVEKFIWRSNKEKDSKTLDSFFR